VGSGVDSPGRGWPGSGNWWPRRGPATRVTRLGWHRITHKRGFADRGVGCGRWVAMSGSVCASLSVDGDEGSPVQEDDARRAESLAGGWARRGRVVHSERRNPRVCSPYRSRAGAGCLDPPVGSARPAGLNHLPTAPDHTGSRYSVARGRPAADGEVDGRDLAHMSRCAVPSGSDPKTTGRHDPAGRHCVEECRRGVSHA
jgi:hypothetical protein